MNFSNHKPVFGEDFDPPAFSNVPLTKIEESRQDLVKRALEEHKLNYLEEGLHQLQLSDSDTSEEDRNNFQLSHPEKENLLLTNSKTPFKKRREIRTEGSSASSRRFGRSPLLDITPNPTKKKKMQPLFVFIPKI